MIELLRKGKKATRKREFTQKGTEQRLTDMIRSICLGRQLPSFRAVAAIGRRWVHFDVSTKEEKRVAETLASKLDASWVQVRDISGGCGAMYEVSVEAEDFRGKRMVQQHKIVNQALSEEVKAMHGLRISTNIPGEKRNYISS
ncbi:bolA-like protein 3 [Nematostella vectensis]|uniref:bolA-like protein 3 n=1 Tax=Nematostella vectensis TaxID=45351 RepID=UPI002076E1F4|nr:bolA-like protein 3 [Nematostella vectensis]